MEPKYRYKLPPCPVYDLAGIQQWLEDMAAQGLHLDEHSGFFMGFGIFTEGQPAQVRYRMEAVRYRKLFSKYKGDPNDGVADLAEEFGWQPVCRHREFDIYRTEDPYAPELNTDPELQAKSLRSVESNLRSSLFSTIFWVILWPMLAYRPGLVALAVEFGLWVPVSILALLAGELGVALYRLIWFARLRKRMQQGLPLPRAAHGRGYQAGKWLHRALAVGTVIALVMVVYRSGDEERRLPLADYPGQPPFATAADVLAALGQASYAPDDLIGRVDGGANTYMRTHHWPAAETVHWEENVRPTGQGEPDYLWLDVDYYQLTGEWAAKALYRELYLREKAQQRTDLLDLALPQAQQAAAFERYHGRILLLRQGTRVIRVQCFGYGNIEVLGRVFAENMQ